MVGPAMLLNLLTLSSNLSNRQSVRIRNSSQGSSLINNNYLQNMKTTCFCAHGLLGLRNKLFMNQNPIVLYVDADDKDSFLNYTQDSNKISKNISHFGEEYAQDIEIQKSIYTDDVVSINIVGKYICILHTNTDIRRMLLFDSMAISDVKMVEAFLLKLFNRELSDDFLYKLKYLKSHSSRSFYPVLLSRDIPSPE